LRLKVLIIYLFLLCGLLPGNTVHAQILSRIDSIKFSNLHFTHNKFVNNIFEQAVNSVKRNPDSGPDDSYLNGKSEDPFLPYQGKIIRFIYVESVNFDRSFTDTSVHDHSLGARIGNHLHRSTRKFAIRNDLFIEEHTPINAFKMADNERYLRSLEYIHDARIVVDSIEGNPDSVDITVYTKDVFSIGGGGASNGLNHFNLNAYDANLAGMAQRLDVSGLYDYTRSPNFAGGGAYRKDNVGGSFIDASVGYSGMSISNYTGEEETTEYLTLRRVLVSPYSRFAGGLTLSHNEAYNPYSSPDSVRFRYKYDLMDGWAGYSIGIKQLNATYEDGFRIFAGVECDILKDGALDFSDEILSRLDYVVASVHSVFNLPEAEMTRRIVKAISNPYVTMLGHMTGRLLLTRKPYALDIPAVLDAAAQTGTLVELNGNPQRLDMDWRWWPLAKEKGVRCVINPDAHNIDGFKHLWFGVQAARKGWLTRADVVNTLPLGKIEAVMGAKRRKCAVENGRK